MIVFDLSCRDNGHRFEGWFRSSSDFERQQGAGLSLCPECASASIDKAAMAPAVGRKGNQAPVLRAETVSPPALRTPAVLPSAHVATVTPEMRKAVETLMQMQKSALEKSRWVGGDFADEARAMHYGERDAEAIHGQATTGEIEDLIDEGVNIAPLPFPVPPPDIVN